MAGVLVAWFAAAILAATGPVPSPPPSPQSAAGATPRFVTVVCPFTPLWLFEDGANLPSRAQVPQATLGARFALVSGPRTTLEGAQYYETNIDAIESGRAGRHYWLARSCALAER